MNALRKLAAAGLSSMLAGCVHTLPPQPIPERVDPPLAVPAPPPGPGMGQVLLDSVGEPAMVEEITGRVEGVDSRGYAVSGKTYRTVCPTTPCAADFPFGTHPLRFSSLTNPNTWGTGDVLVAGEPSAYRYAMGRHTRGQGLTGLVMLAAGVGLVTGGIVFYASGSATNPVTKQAESPGLQPLGIGMAIGGGALAIAGVILFAAFPSEVQDGAGVQWPFSR